MATKSRLHGLIHSSLLRLGVQMLHRSLAPSDRRVLPTCGRHPGSLVRRFRSHGPAGPGVYPQCVPKGGESPHLLAWEIPNAPPPAPVFARLSRSELSVLEDAADGSTVRESAMRRRRSPETVKSQRKTVLAKLGARNMTHAVAIATQEGVLDLERAA